MDFYLYSGGISRSDDLRLMNLVHENKQSEECTVIMCTGGGSADAAYKMARYLQQKYERYTVLVAGPCKSAGTLFAIGASEIAFCPFGELGPLDVQISKDDALTKAESGLDIDAAFSSLEQRAQAAFMKEVLELITNTNGVVTFKTAAEVATKNMSAMYGPIFAQIEPEKLGDRIRSMNVGTEYASRLADVGGNLEKENIGILARGYSSHSFVIDFTEACGLFNSVRWANDDEMILVDKSTELCRFPSVNGTIIECLTKKISKTENQSESSGAKKARTSSGGNKKSSGRAKKKARKASSE